MAPMRSRRWQVWSLDPQSGRWVVVDGGPEIVARGGAARRMGMARRRSMVGAAYVALPPGEEPSAEHRDLAVTEDEVSPPASEPSLADRRGETAHVLLSGTGTFIADESPITLTGSARLSVASDSARNLSVPSATDRFDPDAFAQTIGRVIPMRTGPGQARWVRVAAADVAQDGTSLTLRLEPAAGPDEEWRR